MKRLIEDPMVPVSRMKTLDNAANLSAEAVDALLAMYAGSTLAAKNSKGNGSKTSKGPCGPRT